MKKIFAILALAITGTAFAADSVTVETQRNNNVGGAGQATQVLSVKKEFDGFAGDLSISNTQTGSTNALGTRVETGISGPVAKVGPVTLAVRGSIGQKNSNTISTSYYAIEPSASVPVPGVAGLSAKVGWRWRSAFDDKDNDQTHSMRYSLSYALSKVDTVSIRHDRLDGDAKQRNVILGYTRNF